MTMNTLRTIAVYEMRILLRSWFFRIFAGLAVIGIGIFDVAIMVESGGGPWIYRALPASIPYANLIVLNVGQAIVAIFLSTEFFKQDQKNDTVEVIYARSMSNATYILGKTLGILLVFFVLNLIVLAMGIGFSFLSNDSALHIAAYLWYPILISLPTLVFILGLSFLMMVWVKNQAITFILLLGYVALTIFYLNQKLFGVFDYIAYQVPMMHSTIGGFGNLQETAIHRGMYLMLGISFIFFTIARLPRLPQSNRKGILPVLIGFLCLAAGIFMVKLYLGTKYETQNFRARMIEANDTYLNYPKASVFDYNIDLKHQENEINCNVKLSLHNSTNKNIDTLILSLNPSLKINNVNIEDEPISFERKLHLILIPLNNPFISGDSLSINIEYRGTIDERIAFLDIPDDKFKDNVGFELYRVKKRNAYLTPEFVCLTSNVNWYPQPGIGFSKKRNGYYSPDFSNYNLKVQTRAGLIAVSQGTKTKIDTSTYAFKTDLPIPKISLLIGKYQEQSVKVDSVEYNLFTWQRNNYFKANLDSITDTIPSIIRDLKNEYEVSKGMEYGFRRLNIVEVPLHFSLDMHVHSFSSNAVQPETVLYPEKAVIIRNSDFRRRKSRSERDMKRNNEEVTARELQSRMLKQIIKDNLIANPDQWYMFQPYVNSYSYNIFPNYYSFAHQVKSEDYWLLNQALEVFLYNRDIATGYTSPWSRDGLSKDEKINLELKSNSLESLLQKGIRKEKNEDESISLNQVIRAKGLQLFGMLRARYGTEKFDKFIFDFLAKYKNQAIDFETLNNAIAEEFQDSSINDDVKKWFVSNELPGYLIQGITNNKIIVNEHTKYQTKFKISNPTEVDGQVTVSVEFKDNNGRRNRGWWTDKIDADYSRDVFIPAKSSRTVGMVFSTEPTNMAVYTQISENLPNYIMYTLDGFDKLSSAGPFDTVVPIPFFDTYEEKGEYIVDNEDPGFDFYQTSEKGYLKEIVDKNRDPKYPYSRIRHWNPPNEWLKVLRSGFYGRYIRSAFYTQGGSGERIVNWQKEIEDPGLYEVSFYNDKVEMGGRRNSRPDYHFLVLHSEGEEKITKTWEELEPGWNYLGTWYFEGDTAKVTLTNQSEGNMIFADAVRWKLTR